MSEDDEARLSNDYLFVVRSWLLVADREIRSAHACLNAPIPILETAAYHCQQAAEKLTKGLLVLARVPFRKTHDMEALRDLVVPSFPDLAEMIDRLVPLTDWGHIFRYPDMGGEPVPSSEELRNILSEIQLFADRVTRLVDPGPSG
jgi:HEPN domain-containing protein